MNTSYKFDKETVKEDANVDQNADSSSSISANF